MTARTVPTAEDGALLAPPRLEGTITLRHGRRLGYAEYGPPSGRPVLWFHGSPGARGQIPPVARIAAGELGVRLLSIERPGIGHSTPHLYPAVVNFADDVADFADRLGLDRFGIVALSGGGPYLLACAFRMPERVGAGALLGSVAPTVGVDAADGGIVRLAARFQPLLRTFREPIAYGVWITTRLLRPFAPSVLDLYVRLSPAGDRLVFERPEMRAMFIDDLVEGSTHQFAALVYDLVLFGRDWGFSVRDVRVPVRLWHGDADHIVPLAHAVHLAGLLPDAELRVRPGESHLGSLAAAEEILGAVLEVWDARPAAATGPATPSRTSARP